MIIRITASLKSYEINLNSFTKNTIQDLYLVQISSLFIYHIL